MSEFSFWEHCRFKSCWVMLHHLSCGLMTLVHTLKSAVFNFVVICYFHMLICNPLAVKSTIHTWIKNIRCCIFSWASIHSIQTRLFRFGWMNFCFDALLIQHANNTTASSKRPRRVLNVSLLNEPSPLWHGWFSRCFCKQTIPNCSLDFTGVETKILYVSQQD